MEPIPIRFSHPQIILTHADAGQIYAQNKECFAAALADGIEQCGDFSAKFDIPAGIRLTCPPEEEEENDDIPYFRAAQYKEKCKNAFRSQITEDAAFYYLSGEVSFPAFRTAVLALTDLTGRNIIAELCAENEDGLLFDGTELLAAIGILQKIGVSTLILSAKDMQSLCASLQLIAPYARISLGVRVHSAWIREGILLEGTEFLVCEEHDTEEKLLAAAKKHDGFSFKERDHHEAILAPDGRYAHFIRPTIDISDEIECDHRLFEALLEAEEEAGALKIYIADEDELISFEQHRYMITRPICIAADSPELFEKALAIYPGLALYDGTENFPEEILHYLEQKYGMIRL